MPHGCAQDPERFLISLKAAGDLWTPMNAARLVIGGAADTIRRDMGDQWLMVTITAHLAEARECGEWSFAHSTLQAWLDWRANRMDEADYRQRLAECAEDGIRQYCRAN